jgi:ABC-type Fe3+-siderophore transport system permease subunit
MIQRGAPLWGPVTLLSCALLVALALSMGVGAVALPPGHVLRALLDRTDPALRPADVAIVWDLRLARALLALLVGAGLAGAGSAFQGLFRNPLADPFVIGASGGASLGATLAIVASGSGAGAAVSVPLAAFAGALLAVVVVYLVAAASGGDATTALLLAGATLSTVLSALVALLMLLNDRKLQEIFGWLLGGFSGRSWGHVASSGPLLAIGLAALWLLARPLDALVCGEEGARSLGLPLAHARGAIVVAASLITAAAVAASGIVGFVGLIAPHIARTLVGTGHARLIPVAALIGALLLLLADSAARSLAAPFELPVGIITALAGGPCFLWLLGRGRR